jgi:hypothetical protein
MISAVAGMFSSKRKMSASNIWISMSNSRGRRGRTMALEEGLTAAALHYLLLRAIAGQRQLQYK